MVNKKYILSLCLCLSMFALAGCVESKDLTEEQQDIIAEYSAGVLLQHEESYDRRLVKQESVSVPEPTAAPTATPAPAETESSESAAENEPAPVNEVSLNDLYQVAGMEVSYNSYKICKEYTQEVTAGADERLFVVKYTVKNTTSKPLKIDLTERKIAYRLTLNGTDYDATPGFLKNGGMNFLKTTVKANSSEEAVVVFKIPEAAKNPDSAVVTVRDNDKTSTQKIK